jgi:peptidyl-prolyl cis-trans isomerase C
MAFARGFGHDPANCEDYKMPFRIGHAGRLGAAVMIAAGAAYGAAWAQTAPAAAPSAPAATAPATAGAPADPIVAKVNGKPIYLSQVKAALQDLPPGAHSMPPQALYPAVLDQLIDGEALVVQARKMGLNQDPAVRLQMQEAADRALETALLHKEIMPKISEAAVRAQYEKQIAGKPGVEEVHARHILVPDEATAKKIIAKLDKGADFAKLSKQYSKDPGSAQDGGDLGWFKQDEMVPAFADAAFALKDGQITQTPVHTQFGWHVIQVLGRRKAPPPTFAQAEAALRQKMIQQDVAQVVAKARAGVTVQQYNVDGTPMRPTDNAEPPPSK